MRCHSFVFIFSVCTLALSEHYYDATDKKEPMRIQEFKERFKEEILKRDLPQILNFSNSVIEFQRSLAETYAYLPALQPFLRIKTIFYNDRQSSYPSVFNYKELFTEESNEYRNNSFPLPANDSKRVTCDKSLSTLLKIKLLNSTKISEFLKFDPKVTNRTQSGICSLVLFYAKACPYSIMAVPHYLFLHRIFPQIRMVAVDTVSEQRFNLVFNIIGTPTLILFHNGMPIVVFQGANFTLYELTLFIVNHTDLIPGQLTELTETDLSSFVKPVDMNFTLWFAWTVFVFWVVYYKWHLYFVRFYENYIRVFFRPRRQHRHRRPPHRHHRHND